MVSVFHFILFSCIFSQYYDLNINQTGQSHLVVLQESINLEENWEIGIFDQSAIVNNNSCDDEFGELLVASGVWNQTQLNLAAIGSIDFCDIGGEQMAGYVESNPISVRLYDPNNSVEYSASFSTFAFSCVAAISSLRRPSNFLLISSTIFLAAASEFSAPCFFFLASASESISGFTFT